MHQAAAPSSRLQLKIVFKSSFQSQNLQVSVPQGSSIADTQGNRLTTFTLGTSFSFPLPTFIMLSAGLQVTQQVGK